MLIAFLALSIFTIALELFTRCVLIGWVGANIVVEREISPGPYRFILHALVGILLPILYLVAC